MNKESKRPKCPRCGADVANIIDGVYGTTMDYECGLRYYVWRNPAEQPVYLDHYASECYKSQLAAVTAELDAALRRAEVAEEALRLVSDVNEWPSVPDGVDKPLFYWDLTALCYALADAVREDETE